MRRVPASALLLLAATSVVAAPPAHAACVGPAITAVVDSHGTLVVEDILKNQLTGADFIL